MAFFGDPLDQKLSYSRQCRRPEKLSYRGMTSNLRGVKDEQGRRRFHGAFTGGYSAGYYGTVDTVEGFRPKNFKSHRRKDGNESSSMFQHRPEDYMDDEDFGEFGIAPKKIRLVDRAFEYLEEQALTICDSSDDELLRSQTLPIGEIILRKMGPGLNFVSRHADFQLVPKNDYYGLGYSGLDRPQRPQLSFQSSNPLEYQLKGGKKFKISGAAFGEGILDDLNADQPFGFDEYGIDDLSSYEFTRKTRRIAPSANKDVSPQGASFSHQNEPQSIKGFERAKSNDCNSSCDTNIDSMYPLPKVPKDWKTPSRDKPYVVNQNTLDTANIREKSQSYKDFIGKFMTGSSTLNLQSSDLASRSGLISYSDLKSLNLEDHHTSSNPTETQTFQEPTVERRIVKWKPCSLLCKRFNVPNPS